MNKLAFIPLSLPEESPTSMLRRFALRHGCEYPADLLDLTRTINFKNSTISSESPLPQWIAERAGGYRERFLDGFYKPVGHFTENMPFKVFGTLIPNTMMRFSGNAFCSACRAEGYDRFVKDLRPALFCPYHRRRYHFQCPSCSRQLRWIDPMIDKCVCGHVLECSECSELDCAPEQQLRTLILENRDNFFETLKRTLTILRYDTNSTPENAENRQVFKVALAITNADSASIQDYLRSLQSQYPEMPSAAIGAKLAGIKTPEVLETLKQYSDWTFAGPIETSQKLITQSNFSLYKSQIRETAAIRSITLTKIAVEHCESWIDFPNAKKVPPTIFLPLLQKCREWKFNARKDLTTPADFVSVEEASRMIMVESYFIKKLVDNGDLCPLRKANQKLKIKRNEVENFLKLFESINSIASRLGLPRRKIRRILDRYNLAPVMVARSTRPTIYHRQDVDVMIELRQRSQNSPISRKLNGNDILPENLSAYCTFEEAANTLKISRLILRDYAHAGLFPTYNHPTKSYSMLARKDIDSFHDKYVLPTELGHLIGVGAPVAARTLKDLGHSAVLHESIGDYSYRRPTPIFLRSDIDALCIKRDSTTADYFTIREAGSALRLSDKTIIYLISIGALAIDKDSGNLPWACKSKVKDFFESHANGVQTAKLCNIPVRILQRSLLRFDIKPLCGPLINGCPELIYRIDDIINSAGKVPSYRSSSQDSPTYSIEEFQPITKIIKRYDITKSNFTRTFVQAGLVRPLQIGKELFLTAKDFTLVAGILKKNLTLPMADRVLNAHGYARALTGEGRLSQPKNLPSELDSCTFVTRTSLEKFLRTRPHRPD